MHNTITIGDRNTFDDWHMISPVKLIVNPPQPKFNYVDILGMSGSLDFTEALTKIPRYSDREGSWEFTILNPGDIDQYTIEMEGSYQYDWNDLYDEILRYLHGKYFDRIVLSNDPYHTYRGRIWVNEAQSNTTWGRIVFNYRLEPYKYAIKELTKRSISFPAGEVTETKRVEFNLTPGTLAVPLHFYITAENFEIGTLRAITVNFYNKELNIHSLQQFTGTATFDPDTETYYPKDFDKEIVVKPMVVSNLSGDNKCLFVAGNVAPAYSDVGPIKLEYWWEEASL